MDNAIKKYISAAQCVYHECEKEARAYMKHKEEATLPAIRRLSELMAAKASKKVIADEFKKYEKLTTKLTKGERALKMQMCSVQKCQAHVMKNFEALKKTYEKSCKTDKNTCSLAKMAAAITKKGSVDAKTMAAFASKEQGLSIRAMYGMV